jgi:hypothetical protein
VGVVGSNPELPFLATLLRRRDAHTDSVQPARPPFAPRRQYIYRANTAPAISDRDRSPLRDAAPLRGRPEPISKYATHHLVEGAKRTKRCLDDREQPLSVAHEKALGRAARGRALEDGVRAVWTSQLSSLALARTPAGTDIRTARDNQMDPRVRAELQKRSTTLAMHMTVNCGQDAYYL